MAASVLPFSALLTRRGARSARSGKKWHCPECPEKSSPTLSVNWDRELAYCHRCRWKANRRILERELGMKSPKPTPEEVIRRRSTCTVAERVWKWWRWEFYRDLNRMLQGIERDAQEAGQEYMARGQPVPEWVFSNLDYSLREQERTGRNFVS